MFSVRVHTMPFNDVRGDGRPFTHYASPLCPCQPLAVPGEPGFYEHHAFDCREKLERQGHHNDGKPWGNVCEIVNTTTALIE